MTDKRNDRTASIKVLGLTELDDDSDPTTGGSWLYLAPEVLEGKAATVQALPVTGIPEEWTHRKQ